MGIYDRGEPQGKGRLFQLRNFNRMGIQRGINTPAEEDGRLEREHPSGEE
jgi:hypothetical protein